MSIKKYITNIVKKLSDGLEAARTISYVETVSNKADTLHRYVKINSEQELKRAFEFNARKAIGGMSLEKQYLPST